jgi:Flp pilus assembly protein TadD
MPKAQDDDFVMNLVEQALSRPPDTREAWLREACDGDTEMFNEVWDYVQWNHRMKDFLIDPLFSTLSEHRFAQGDLLADRFRIVREVAQGGMGIVYEATDEKLGKRIALKCAKSGFRGRLPPEVRHASEISHPNVCKIFDIHTAETGRGRTDFFTMEFLEGETLAARLGRGPLPEAEARTIGRQICAGLAEAHRNRVVHGDLKSNNVILSRDADGGVRAVITDFGLARRPHGPGEDVAGGAAAGSSEAGGTPAYMAPELWTGQKPSAASDIYAFGMILYELLAGHRPHERESPRQGHLKHSPTAETASTVSLQTSSSWPERSKQKPPAVQHEWNWIVRRCLDPDPARRFRDAGEVAAALEPAHSRRWWLGAAAAAVLAVVSGVVTYQRATAPKESLRLAVLPVESSSADMASVAGDLSREVTGHLRRLNGGRVARLAVVDASRQGRTAQQATHRLRATVGKENGKLRLHAVLTDVRSGVNLKDWNTTYAPEEVRRYAPAALAGMVTSALRLPPPAIASVSPAAAHDYWAGVWYTRQNSTLDQAIRALGQAVARDSDSALTYAALAEAQWFEYYLTSDRTWLDRTRESLRQAERRNPDLPAVHRVEGYLYYADDSYSQAAAEFERAIELYPAGAMAHIYLGKAYEDNNQLDKALTEFLKATEVEPGYFRTWQNLGAYYQDRSDFSEMARYHKKAVDLAPNEPNLHANLAGAYMVEGKFAEAEYELRRSIGLQETLAADNVLAQILMYEGNDAAAVQSFERALDLPSPPGTPKFLILMYLGIAQRRLHRIDAARKANTQGLKMVEAENPLNVRDGDVKSFMGYFSAAIGDRARAIDSIETALGLFPDNSATRWRAVLTYEELYRLSGDPNLRKRTMEILSQSTVDQLADVSRWPDLADLHQDLRFKDLVAARHIR